MSHRHEYHTILRSLATAASDYRQSRHAQWAAEQLETALAEAERLLASDPPRHPLERGQLPLGLPCPQCGGTGTDYDGLFEDCQCWACNGLGVQPVTEVRRCHS